MSHKHQKMINSVTRYNLKISRVKKEKFANTYRLGGRQKKGEGGHERQVRDNTFHIDVIRFLLY